MVCRSNPRVTLGCSGAFLCVPVNFSINSITGCSFWGQLIVKPPVNISLFPTFFHSDCKGFSILSPLIVFVSSSTGPSPIGFDSGRQRDFKDIHNFRNALIGVVFEPSARLCSILWCELKYRNRTTNRTIEIVKIVSPLRGAPHCVDWTQVRWRAHNVAEEPSHWVVWSQLQWQWLTFKPRMTGNVASPFLCK